MLKNKSILAIIIIAIMVFAIPTITNAAQVDATETTTTSTGKVAQWTYIEENGKVTNLLCKNASELSGTISIPATLDGKEVLSLGSITHTWDKGIFEGSFITSVTIPNSVINIGANAFKGCKGLTTIIIPNSVMTIGNSAFENCTGLQGEIVIPSSVMSISSAAFKKCTGITNIKFEEGITTIGGEAFRGCIGLTTLTIPDSVTSIGENAFDGCSGINNMTLSSNLVSLESKVFANCSGLINVVIPDKVTTIDNYTFESCSNLKKILIPDSVASIGDSAFWNTKNFTIYGNDGKASKTYAETKNIAFDYIANWDNDASGEDITAPVVKNMYVKYSSVMGYWDSTTSTFRAPANAQIIIIVKFSEEIKGGTAPTLGIQCGVGTPVNITGGTITGDFITYTYKIRSTDLGQITVKYYTGGDVTDLAENEAELSCKPLNVEYHSNDYVYANGESSETPEEDDVSVESVTLNKTEISLEVGKVFTIVPTIKPTNASNKKVTYTTSDAKIAKVGSDGVVTAVAEGTATITVTTEDGAKTATCKVIVTKAASGDDKKTFGDNKYLIIEQTMSWEEAKAYCESLGGYLVTITSAEEQKFIEDYINEKGYKNKRFWLGFSDVAKEGTWNWVTGESNKYTNWGKSLDNGYEGTQDYAALVGFDTTYGAGKKVNFGQWDDVQKSKQSDCYFICEWGEYKKDTTTTTTTIPDAGKTIGISITLLAIVALGTLGFVKYKKYKDV